MPFHPMFLTLFGPLTLLWRGEKEAKTWDAVAFNKLNKFEVLQILKDPAFFIPFHKPTTTFNITD